MRITLAVRAALAAAWVAVSASVASAQIYETVGIRAQGMGGAFVAVADDATASWWNPAGLPTGASFSAIVERDTTEEPADPAPSGPAWQSLANGYSVAYPALGLSYYRLRISEIGPVPASSTAAGQPGRQDQGGAGVRLRSIAMNQLGASVGQSLGRHLVLGSTLKLVRAGSIASTDVAAEGALDHAADLDVPLETHSDLDLGAMASFGAARLGVSVKHVTEPRFGEGDDSLLLSRQVRVGVAVLSAARGGDGVTVAFDADLTRTATAVGDARHVAAGAEARLFQRRVGVRGGVSANTVGGLRASTSAGLSVGTRSGMYVDGAATFGADQSRNGWGFALRVTF